jgi:hypothetical protein
MSFPVYTTVPLDRTITLSILFRLAARHHPAARVLAFRLEVDGLAFLQQLERRRPKLQMQDLALPRQHIVLHAQPSAWSSGAPAQSRRATRCASSATSPSPASIACSVADSATRSDFLDASPIVRRRARVKVPAVVIERTAGSASIVAHIGRLQVLQVLEAHHHVRRPARRCCRCSSAPPRDGRESRSIRTNVSPSVALRRCPICAALLGLILVCSTITFPVRSAATAAGCSTASP